MKPTFDVHAKLRKIVNIGHKHEEVKEWFECKKCQEAHFKYIEERQKLKKLYPMEFLHGKMGGPLNMDVKHKL